MVMLWYCLILLICSISAIDIIIEHVTYTNEWTESGPEEAEIRSKRSTQSNAERNVRTEPEPEESEIRSKRSTQSNAEPGREEAEIRSKRSTQSNAAKNVSFLLNNILRDYDKNFRPGFDSDETTTVFIDLFVRTMGPISEMTDSYSFDCYFRQTWRDERLKFSTDQGNTTLSLGMSMLDKIWKPDTFFWNGQGSYLHTLTTPNLLVRLSEDGVVLFSSRLTVKARCQMDLHRFPLDVQACRLVIGSFAYANDEMQFRWKTLGGGRGVHLDYAALADLPQFELRSVQVMNNTPLMRDASYSALEVRFFLHRHVGYFVINYYLPCSLIILLSWIALWINREATGDRIALGITSVLTMTFLSLDSRSDTPRVEYPTALDVYILICFFTLFICIIESAIVHQYTKFNTGDPEVQRLEREKLRALLRKMPRESMLSSRRSRSSRHSESRRSNGSCMDRRDGGRYSVYGRRKYGSQGEYRQLSAQISSTPFEKDQLRDNSGGELNAFHEGQLNAFHEDSLGWRLYYWMISDDGSRHDVFELAENSISTLDRVCRILLPILFAITVLIYYNWYVNRAYDFVFADMSLA